MTNRENPYPLNDAVLGESSGKQLLHGINQCKQVTLGLANQAKRSINIFSYDLDSKIYNQTDFIEALKNLAIRSEHSHIKILLQNNEKVQREGHRIIELWRRLTSKIEIRKPPADYIGHLENFMLVDETGYLHRKIHTEYDATVDFNSRFETRKLSMFFDEVWEQSEPDSQLRSLHI